jgi:hypothetical protein
VGLEAGVDDAGVDGVGSDAWGGMYISKLGVERDGEGEVNVLPCEA